jgi:hypothetical protein
MLLSFPSDDIQMLPARTRPAQSLAPSRINTVVPPLTHFGAEELDAFIPPQLDISEIARVANLQSSQIEQGLHVDIADTDATIEAIRNALAKFPLLLHKTQQMHLGALSTSPRKRPRSPMRSFSSAPLVSLGASAVSSHPYAAMHKSLEGNKNQNGKKAKERRPKARSDASPDHEHAYAPAQAHAHTSDADGISRSADDGLRSRSFHMATGSLGMAYVCMRIVICFE